MHDRSESNSLDSKDGGGMHRPNDVNQVSYVCWIYHNMTSELANVKNLPNNTMCTILVALLHTICHIISSLEHACRMD